MAITLPENLPEKKLSNTSHCHTHSRETFWLKKGGLENKTVLFFLSIFTLYAQTACEILVLKIILSWMDVWLLQHFSNAS